MKNLKTRNSSCFDFDVRGESRKQTFCKAIIGLFISSKVFLMNTNQIRTIESFANDIVRIPIVIANNDKLLIISNHIHQVMCFVGSFPVTNNPTSKKVQHNWNQSNDCQTEHTNSDATQKPFSEYTYSCQCCKNKHSGNISLQRMIEKFLNPFHSTNIQKIIYGTNIAKS